MKTNLYEIISPTAEKIFHKYNGYDVRCAGIEYGARIKVTSGHIGWADLIFVMEKNILADSNKNLDPYLMISRSGT